MTKEEKEKFINIQNEVLNDAFWLGYILELKRGIDDHVTKLLLSNFLLFYSAIFCDETLKANQGELSGKRNISKKDIDDLRSYCLKYVHNNNSDKTKEIIREMGIDFDSYMFDITITVDKNNELLDINFRHWSANKKENFELNDGVVATPYRWIEVLFPELFPAIKDILKDVNIKYRDKLLSMRLQRKSYSCYRMFRNTKIDDNSKIYILQKYGLIKTIIFIENTLGIDISFNIGPFNIDFNRFWTKVKAVIIEGFWEDSKNAKVPIIENIFEKNKDNIDSKFYPLNRKLRDNIHYNHIDNLTAEELAYLKNQQKIYLNNVISEFDRHLYIRFNKRYQFDYMIAKLISDPDLLKNNKWLLLLFIIHKI